MFLSGYILYVCLYVTVAFLHVSANHSALHQPIRHEISSFSCKLYETVRNVQTASSFPNSNTLQLFQINHLNKDETNEATSPVSTVSNKTCLSGFETKTHKKVTLLYEVYIKNMCNVRFTTLEHDKKCIHKQEPGSRKQVQVKAVVVRLICGIARFLPQ